MARRELQVTHYTLEMVLVAEENGRHARLRVTLHGPNFPQRAIAPEIIVGDLRAENVAIAHDQRSIRGYFRGMPAEGAQLRVLYGDSQEGVAREGFTRAAIRPLTKECS